MNSQTLSRCKQAFQSVVHIAVQELCKAANALVLPVTLGVVKPTTSFSLLTSSSLEVSIVFMVQFTYKNAMCD